MGRPASGGSYGSWWRCSGRKRVGSTPWQRIQDGQFCLLIPEGDRAIAVRLAEQLRLAIEEHPFVATPSGEIVRLAVNTGVAASEGGKDDRAAMLSQGRSSLEQSRNERRISGFRA